MRSASLSAVFGMASEPAKGRRRTSASVEPLENRRLFSAAYAGLEPGGASAQAESVPTISVDDARLIENDSGQRRMVFLVRLSEPNLTDTVAFTLTPTSGTAVGGLDYRDTPIRGSVAPGVLTTTLESAFDVIGDTLVEGDEQFLVNVSDVENATVADGQAVGTIIDNDGPPPQPTPSFAIDDLWKREADGGTSRFHFILRRDPQGRLDETSSVTYTTAYGTADGDDLDAQSGTVTFPPFAERTLVTVDVKGDAATEDDETFFVNLSDPVNATIDRGQGLGVIMNDDEPGAPPMPTISVDDARLVEGDAGESQMAFVVRLSEPSPGPVDFVIRTAGGTATEGEDYTRTAFLRTFEPGTTTMTVNVPVSGDTGVEADEQFTVNLSDVNGATLADGQAVGTIVNDDPGPSEPPALSIDDVTRNEGNSGLTAFTFTVTRSSGDGTSSVKYATEFEGNTSVQDMAVQSGDVTFAPGETSKRLTLYVKGDRNVETDNVFYVNLSEPTNAAIADGRGKGTIVNDDAPPASSTLNINNVTRNEGDSGKTAFTFTVTRSSGVGAASVKYATAYGFNASKEDFAAQSGTVSFAAGQTSKSLTVWVNGDRNKETDNTFFVNLSSPVNAVIGDGQGLGTIKNDD